MNKKKHKKISPSVMDVENQLRFTQSAKQQKRFDLLIAFILIAFGAYHSILFFGHQIVPNSDWPAFIQVGQNLLSFTLPTDYKRAPVLGILQILLSKFMPSQNPVLLAGLLLNAVLHPFTILLLWLTAKNFIGRGAWFFAIIAILSPYVMAMLVTPIVETVFLFFIVLTFYLIFKRSRWSYIFASITSMLRYEGASLILAALVIDLLTRKDKKERLKAVGYAVLASVPLGLWALGTFLNWSSQSQLTYIREIGTGSGGRIVWREFIEMIWQGGFSVLFIATPDMSPQAVNILMAANKIFVGISFVFGSIYGLYKRQWNILVLLLFLSPYIMIHAIYSFTDLRYGVPVFWIVLLICLYGLKSLWDIINKDERIPAAVIIGLQAALLIPIIIWLITLLGYVGETSVVSPRSISIPYVTMGVAAVIFIMARILYRKRYLWFDTVLCAILCLMVVSNQFSLASVIKDGRQDAEFKQLADWYCANAKPHEKMASFMAGVLGMLAPAQADNFIHTGALTGKTPDDFIRNCYEKGVTYVAWDSRDAIIGKDRRFYDLWHVETINFLSRPRSIGPYEYITTIRESDERFVNIFRLKPRKDADKIDKMH